MSYQVSTPLNVHGNDDSDTANFTTITLPAQTASRALVLDATGNVVSSVVTAAELGYMSGVTSAVQTQFTGKASLTGATFTGNVGMTGAELVFNTRDKCVRFSFSDPMPMVEKNYGITDRYGIGQAGGGQMRMYTSGSFAAANVALSYCTSATAFADMLTCNKTTGTFNVDTRVNGNLVVTANVTASNVIVQSLTASRAVVSDASDALVSSAVTSTELGYLGGVTSAVQTQLNAKQPTVTGAATTIVSSDLTADRAVVSDAGGKVAAAAVTATEMSYLGGVTSAVQTQLNAKQPTVTGAATTIVSSDLAADRAVVSDAGGKVAAAAVTATELGYLGGVTSAVQTQLDAKAGLAGATFTGNVTAANVIVQSLTASRAVVSDASDALVSSAVTSTELGYMSGVTSAIQTQFTGKASLTGATFTGTVGMANVNVNSGRFLDLGFGNATREGNAGKIGYGVFSGTNLDIVGAGVTGAAVRNVRIYDALNAVQRLTAPIVETSNVNCTTATLTLRTNTTVTVATSDSAGLRFVHDDATSATAPVVRCSSRNASTYTGSVLGVTSTRASSTAFNFVLATAGFGGTPDNKFRVAGDGSTFADGAYAATGADYAELFEWTDGNPAGEDRRGMTVTLVGPKIQVANGATTIIGVVSSAPAIVGDSAWSYWQGKYLRDEFGKVIEEQYELWSWTADDGEVHEYASDAIPEGIVVPENKVVVAATRGKLNPEYDPASVYVPRQQRKEWACVGLVGKLRVRVGQVVPDGWMLLRVVSPTVNEYLVR